MLPLDNGFCVNTTMIQFFSDKIGIGFQQIVDGVDSDDAESFGHFLTDRWRGFDRAVPVEIELPFGAAVLAFVLDHIACCAAVFVTIVLRKSLWFSVDHATLAPMVFVTTFINSVTMLGATRSMGVPASASTWRCC